MPQMLPQHIQRVLQHLAAALSPAIVLLLADAIVPWSDALPRAYEPNATTVTNAVQVLSDLSSFQSTLAGGLMLGAIVLPQQVESLHRNVTVGLALTLLCGLLSLYCGFRFQIDLAAQLTDFGFNLRLIGDRLRWQSYCLVGSACALFYAFLAPSFTDAPIGRTA